MLPKAPKSLRRIHGRNRVLRENDFSTRLADPHAEFIIIRQHISDGFETSHFLHPFFPRGDGAPQSEADSFLPSGHQHSGKKIAGSAHGFELGAKVVLSNRAIERSHCSKSLLA